MVIVILNILIGCALGYAGAEEAVVGGLFGGDRVAAWKSMDGKQGGDPVKLAHAIVKLAALDEPPTRFAAGADAVQTLEAKANALLSQAHVHRGLSASLAYEDA
jgi:hypothetical protein